MKILKHLNLGLALPLLLAGGVGMAWHQKHDDNQAAAYLTSRVERGDVEDTVSALGTLQPLQYVDVGTQVTGQLRTLHVSVGKQVRQGDLVAEIDPTLFASRVETTEASLQSAEAQLSERIVQQRLAQQQYARNKDLYASQAVSEEVFQQSMAAVDQAAAQVRAQRAQVKQIQSQLQGDRANLRYTKIFAPMSGTVVSLNAREGQTLVSSQQAPTILRIADLNTMTVWAQVSEADVPKIALRMPVYFSTLGLPERRWFGTVRQILPTPENLNNVVLYDVLFDVTNADQTLKPEMSAQASFVIAKAENSLVVPVSALRIAGKQRHGKGKHDGTKETKKNHKSDRNDLQSDEAFNSQAQHNKRQYTVRVLKQDGQIEERRVEVGVMSRINAEVISGLAEGEEVIVGMAEDAGKKNSKYKVASTPGKL